MLLLGQVSKIRSYQKTYPDALVYTMTVKPLPGIENVACFTPKRVMVYGYKQYAGWPAVSEAAYTKAYIDLLNSRKYAIYRWYKAIRTQDVILCCFCRPGNFCHRRLLYQYLCWLEKKFSEHITLVLD